MVEKSQLSIIQQYFPDIKKVKDIDKYILNIGSENVSYEQKYLNDCIEASLKGKYEDSNNKVNIILKDPLFNKEEFERMLSKFYSVVRYQLY